MPYENAAHRPSCANPWSKRYCSQDIRSKEATVLLGRLVGRGKAEKVIRNWFSPICSWILTQA